MEANQLRIGNFVGRKYWNPHPTNPSWEIEVCKILELRTKHALVIFKSGEKSKMQYEELQPILLTQDRLVKFGFKKSMAKENYVTYNNGKIGVGLYSSYAVIRLCQIRFHFVHQLQNIYHALTKTELELTTP